ncbi:uncharacterized protein N7503_000214 [Penicillium pulvis]|uniref:uncharacterized protein n=1 Tax=Penicillium pulvis TaxID=1562058 RepID=UPI00254878D5|nr:uncharacterized protein N7503_000214 [Penicillium pulvis]KAJ5813464.1 hypothetical protein N7503_000214 [Penicillium pulvis]
MPLPTILEHEPTSLNEMMVQGNLRASSLPKRARKSEAKLAKASALMAALPSPIHPCSRPMTPDSLFGEITDPKYAACPVPDEPISPIFIHCMNCWRKDHPTESNKCEFQKLRNYWKSEHEEELAKHNSHSKAQLAFLAAGYHQLQANYATILAHLEYLEFENSQLRAANIQLHADMFYSRPRRALDSQIRTP